MIQQAGFEFLFMVVVAIIWVIGNVSKQQAEQKRRQEMRRYQQQKRQRQQEQAGENLQEWKEEQSRQPQKRTAEDELRDFLETLTGGGTSTSSPREEARDTYQDDDVEIDEDPYEVEPARPVLAEPEAPPPPRRQAPASPPPSRRAPPPPAPPVVPVARMEELEEMDYSDAYTSVAEVKELDLSDPSAGLGDEMDMLKNVQMAKVDLSSTVVEILRVPTPSMAPSQSSVAKPRLRNRDTLRRAVIGEIILSKPKALMEDPFEHS